MKYKAYGTVVGSKYLGIKVELCIKLYVLIVTLLTFNIKGGLMAKNAINIINAQREVIQAELHRLNKKYTNLKTEHQKLVEETVELENKNVKLTDAIDTMCKGCVLKYTDQCVQCNLHEVAVELIWQLES